MKTDLDSEIQALLGDETPATVAEMVDSKVVADWLGMTVNRVNRLAADGVIPREGKTGSYRFPLKAAVQAYCTRSRAASSQDPRMTDAKARLAHAQADKAETQAALARGQLVAVQEVKNRWTTIATDLRGQILAIAPRLAADLNLNRKTANALDAALRAALGGIADDE